MVVKRQPQRYAQLAVRVLGEDPYDHSEYELALIFAKRLEDHFKTLGLGTSLHELDIPREAIRHIADQLTHDGTSTVGNYSPLTRDDVIEVLELAY